MMARNGLQNPNGPIHVAIIGYGGRDKISRGPEINKMGNCYLYLDLNWGAYLLKCLEVTDSHVRTAKLVNSAKLKLQNQPHSACANPGPRAKRSLKLQA